MVSHHVLVSWTLDNLDSICFYTTAHSSWSAYFLSSNVFTLHRDFYTKAVYIRVVLCFPVHFSEEWETLMMIRMLTPSSRRSLMCWKHHFEPSCNIRSKYYQLYPAYLLSSTSSGAQQVLRTCPFRFCLRSTQYQPLSFHAPHATDSLTRSAELSMTAARPRQLSFTWVGCTTKLHQCAAFEPDISPHHRRVYCSSRLCGI